MSYLSGKKTEDQGLPLACISTWSVRVKKNPLKGNQINEKTNWACFLSAL